MNYILYNFSWNSFHLWTLLWQRNRGKKYHFLLNSMLFLPFIPTTQCACMGVCGDLLEFIFSSRFFAPTFDQRWHEKFPCFVSIFISTITDVMCTTFIFFSFFFSVGECALLVRLFPLSLLSSLLSSFPPRSWILLAPRSSLYRCLSFLWTEQLLLVETLFNNYTNLIHNSYGLEKKLLFIFSVFKIAPVRTLSPFLRILMLLNSISHTIDYKRYGWYEFHHSTIFINTSQFQLRFSFEFSPFFLSLSFSALAFQANRKKNSFLCAHSN